MSSFSLPQFNPLTPIQDTINDHSINRFILPQQTQLPPIFADYMPNQSFSSISPTLESIAANEEFGFNKHQSIPHPPQDIYHHMNQSSASKNKLSDLGDLINHDWEAVRYFLKCQVRCGGDVLRVYKCNFCGHEFPNAQAFGGHMSSHSKTKKSSPKKTNRARKESFNFCSGNERRLRMARGMMKDSLKESLENEESMNGEIVEESTGEEWYQYLNSDAE